MLVHLCVGKCTKRHQISWKLELQMSVSNTMWVQGTKLESLQEQPVL